MDDIAVVTGGSSGLGFALAQGLARRGGRVALLARDAGGLERSVERLREAGADASGFPCDVSREAQVRDAFSHIATRGTVRRVFNAAGVGRFGPPEAISETVIDQVLSGNLNGLMLVTAAALPLLREAGGGTIVSVLSTAALVGRANQAVYCAAKWGARGFMQALRAELEGTSIRTLTVYPGGMRTRFWSKEAGRSPELRGYMDPDDVAEHILAVALDPKSAYVSEMTINRR